MKKVAIIMGSDSDLPVVEKALEPLKEYGVPYEMFFPHTAHRSRPARSPFQRVTTALVSSSVPPERLRIWPVLLPPIQRSR